MTKPEKVDKKDKPTEKPLTDQELIDQIASEFKK